MICTIENNKTRVPNSTCTMYLTNELLDLEQQVSHS